MNCDALARWYRWLEYAAFGWALERRREAFQTRLTNARRVLMLGEGDGRFLTGFLRRNLLAEVDCVDASTAMLALAKRRADRAMETDGMGRLRVHFHRSDALAWLRSQSSVGYYDAVCTHFFLDCFTTEELSLLVTEAARLAAGGSIWIVSEFCYLPAGLRRLLSRGFVSWLYQFFRLTTGLRVNRLPDHRAVLDGAGFRLRERACGFGGLLVSECWERS